MTSSINYALLAFLGWGLLPLFLKQMPSLDAYEITSFRVIFSALSLCIFISYRSSVKDALLNFKKALKKPALYLSTFLIGINWFLFVYCIAQGRILDASFGYFSGPLISVLLGVLFLKEKLNNFKLVAIALVLISVFIQAIEMGRIPLISVVLALSFALYGLIKKVTRPEPLGSLFFESLMITPIAIIYLIFFSDNTYLDSAKNVEFIYILFSGVVTIVPLVFFTKAAKNLALNTLGLIQYISPLTQFAIGVFIYNESLSQNKIISFILIWISCMIILINQNIRARSLK